METIGRHELTDKQWERLEPLLPPRQGRRGRPSLDHRTIINGILWIDKTGAPWRDMPKLYGSWKTVSSRLYRWRRAGIWDKIWAKVQTHADVRGDVQWSIHFVDSSIVRAHQHAAGARSGEPEVEALGRSQGGLSTKIHVRCEGKGKPVVFELTGGQQHEATMFERLMEGGAIKREGKGRPRRLPARVAADKGYSSKKVRLYLSRRGIGITIPRKSNEKHRGRFDKELYKQRNRVERLFNRLKQFRRIATRYEKRAANYKTMLTLAAIVFWL
jgi:transposase